MCGERRVVCVLGVWCVCVSVGACVCGVCVCVLCVLVGRECVSSSVC